MLVDVIDSLTIVGEVGLWLLVLFCVAVRGSVFVL